MKACNFIIKRVQHRCIPVNTAKCFRQFFYRTHYVTASAYNTLKIRKLKKGYISQILGVVAFENTLQTKTCLKSTTKKHNCWWNGIVSLTTRNFAINDQLWNFSVVKSLCLHFWVMSKLIFELSYFTRKTSVKN